jgi:glucose uptake protein GlcU
MFFGSNYVPVKKVNVGDGIFFSACMSIGILMVGMVVNWTLGEQGLAHFPPHGPQFEPKAAIGGMLWMLGNFMCPTIVKLIGLGLGLAVWDCANLIMGWATGAFGLFGVWQEEITSPVMNRAGLVMACASLVLLAFACDGEDPAAQVEETKQQPFDIEEGRENEGNTVNTKSLQQELPAESIAVVPKQLEHSSTASTLCSSSASLPIDDSEVFEDLQSDSSNENPASAQPSKTATDQVTEVLQQSSPEEEPANQVCVSSLFETAKGRMTLGFVLSIVAGTLFGLTFDWPTDLMQLGKLGRNHSTNPLDYVFSHFVGIVVTGFAVLMVYLVRNKGESFTPCNVILPAIASGMMWGVAQVAWFQANMELPMVIAFPIISTLPGIVGMIWGWAFFGEFRGTRSRRLALAALCIRVPAVALIGLSNVL